MNTFAVNRSKVGERKVTPPHSGGQRVLGFFFALTGALIATSFLNIGDSGLPLFYLVVLVPAFAAIFPGIRPATSPIDRREISIYLSIGGMFLSLSVVTFFQIAGDTQSPIGELTHAISRLSFLGYCAACVYYLRGAVLASCLLWLRRILTLVALYGVYQVPAKILGFPLVFDWLRNNHSFTLYGYDSAGWISLVRATSVYAEPSQCTVPVLVLIFLNIHLRAPRWSKHFVWAVVSAFGLLTFSRTIWVAVLGLIGLWFLMRYKAVRTRLDRGKLLLAFSLVVVSLLMPVWAFYGGNYKADLSRQERAGSVVIGIELIKQHPFIGSGWNSYETLMPGYPIDVENVSPEVTFKTIHNMFVSYAEQAGIGGFVFALFPFMAILFWSHAPTGLKYGCMLSFLIVAELGGDVAYSSLFWLWIAVLLNWTPHSNVDSRASVEPRVLRYAA